MKTFLIIVVLGAVRAKAAAEAANKGIVQVNQEVSKTVEAQ